MSEISVAISTTRIRIGANTIVMATFVPSSMMVNRQDRSKRCVDEDEALIITRGRYPLPTGTKGRIHDQPAGLIRTPYCCLYRI